MHSVIDGAYAQVFGFSSHKNVDIIIDRTDEDCWVSGDVHLLERAVTNILYNAVQHTPTGNKVTIRLYAQQGIQVVVSDTGAGIPSDLIPHLFEPYFRARKKQQDQSERNRSQVDVLQDDLSQAAPFDTSVATYGAKSYGLGLSFVHTVVERHGGSIHVESVLGKNTSFLLKFPAISVD